MPVEEWEQMDQPTFADLEFQGKKRKTRRELFLERMDGLSPWQSLEARILPPAFSGAGSSTPRLARADGPTRWR
jgi:hypothetical protein